MKQKPNESIPSPFPALVNARLRYIHGYSQQEADRLTSKYQDFLWICAKQPAERKVTGAAGYIHLKNTGVL